VRAGAVIVEDDAILLVEFHDETGLHYNLPGGGVESNESILEAVKREAKEEASIDVEVGPLAFVYEYVPHFNDNKYGETRSLSLFFECNKKAGSIPSFPELPDPNQTGVKWVKLSELHNIVLLPNMKNHIINYIREKRNIDMIEEQLLQQC